MPDDIPSDAPINKPLHEAMRCGILTNEEGDTAIIHDKPFSSEVQWIEYEQQENKLWLVLENGQVQDLGIKLEGDMVQHLLKSKRVMLVQMIDKKILSSQECNILIKEY